jgi:DHA3 family tetracycline resistance protein-like MFS transporter
MSEQHRIGIFRPLTNHDFRLLWTGLAVSLLGDGIYLVSIAWLVLDLYDLKALSLVGLAWTLPTVLLLMVTGVLTDRLPRRRLMLVADGVRFLAIGTMGVLVITGQVRLWHLIVLAAIYGAGEALFGPANSAILPDLVPAEQLVQANSLAQFVRPFAQMLLGPALGGVLVRTVGPGWAFIVDAATFAWSASMILRMTERAAVRHPDADSTHWADLKEGFRFVRSRTWLWASMSVATVSLLCFWGPFEVLVPDLVKKDLHGSALDLGLVFAAGGFGAIIAAGISGQRGMPRRPLTVMYSAWAFGTLLLAGFGLAHSLWPMYLVSALSQAMFTILMVNWFTVFQLLVPTHIRGRVSSLDWFVSTAGVPLSFALTGPIAAAFGPRHTLIGAGIVGSAVIVLTVLVVPGILAPDHDGSLDAGRSAEAL